MREPVRRQCAAEQNSSPRSRGSRFGVAFRVLGCPSALLGVVARLAGSWSPGFEFDGSKPWFGSQRWAQGGGSASCGRPRAARAMSRACRRQFLMPPPDQRKAASQIPILYDPCRSTRPNRGGGPVTDVLCNKQFNKQFNKQLGQRLDRRLSVAQPLRHDHGRLAHRASANLRPQFSIATGDECPRASPMGQCNAAGFFLKKPK